MTPITVSVTTSGGSAGTQDRIYICQRGLASRHVIAKALGFAKDFRENHHLGRSGYAASHRQSLQDVLILLYKYMTMPSKYAVRSTANPQATNEAEKLHGLLSEARSRCGTIVMQSQKLKPQSSLRDCFDWAQ